jgi:Tol biopolymer transport system component
MERRRERAHRIAASAAALALPCLVLAIATASQAAFPGTNGKIAFGSDPTGSDREVYAITAAGGAPSNLSNDPGNDDSDPSWSADGGKIVFSTDRDLNDELYRMNADGSGQTRLTNTSAFETVPVWSPDGAKIAYTRDDGTFNLEIYAVNADGSAQTDLSNNPSLDTSPAWSPDGSKIAFTTTRDGNSEIYTMNVDGSGQTRLTDNPATDSGPDWAANGQKIVFASSRDGNREIYVMNGDGSGQTRLTTNSASDLSPAFSPDGQNIAFRSNRDGNYEIYVMNADGTSQTRLTNNTWLDLDPDWQPLAGNPTAATVLSFEAHAGKEVVLLRWRAASEAGTLGYNVFRQEKGRRVRVNPTLIPAARTPEPHLYRWVDRSGGSASRYWLQRVRLDGSGAWHGPARVS